MVTFSVGTGVVATALVLLTAVIPQQPPTWQTEFGVDKATLAATGHNRFFVLVPGQQSVFSGGGVELTITVLRATELVDGVTTAVVEERESKNGALVEVSRNFFAISTRDDNVYYFGEDVDMYSKGKIISHEGAWRAGVAGAKFGLFMPGRPTVGMRFYQEIAPKVAMDRAEIVSTTESVKVPAGSFTGCVRVEETTPLEPAVKEYKLYCEGVGLVQDSDLKLQKRVGAK